LTIILHGSISQKTILNIILAAVRTWYLTTFIPHSSLMMDAARTSETSVDNHFTGQYNPEDNSEHSLDIW
jgi:hypothetical protein